MFVQYTTTIPLGLGTVEKVLSRLGGELGDLADIAYREGEELRSRVGPTGLVAKAVTLEIGAPQLQRRGLVYPLHWTAAGAEALFPEMHADLILTQNGKQETVVTFAGTYDPPLGRVGRALDRALMNRVAEATVRNWVDRLVAAITEAA
ncbi:MAG TPA: hypothetical protein VF246_03530 [Acidimicrobiia bacterium]